MVQQLGTCLPDNMTDSQAIRHIHITTAYSAFLVQIVAKAEFLNPGGSVKDRVALHIIQDAFAQGRLTEGGLIAEGTAGSTGRHPPIKILTRECPTSRSDCYPMQNQTVMHHVMQFILCSSPLPHA